MKNIPRFIPPLTISEISSSLKFKENANDCCNELQMFAKKFAEYIGVRYAIPVPAARIGLSGLLRVLQFPANSEVIIPALTHYRMATTFLDFGLKPRFVDIHPFTYCIDTDKIEAAITSSTVAILAVHLYGRACDMMTIKKIADKYNLVIIEDCAQGCGSFCSGRRVGSFGKAAVFSFHPHKNISTLGGGMVVTDSQELAFKISSEMNELPKIGKIVMAWRIFHAMALCFVTKYLFWNYIMVPILKVCAWRGMDPVELVTDETPSENRIADMQVLLMPRVLQGRIGQIQLEKLDDWNRIRIRNGNRLLERLQGVNGVKVPAKAPEGENIYMSFVIQTKNREIFRRHLLDLGVDTHPGNMFVGPYLPGLQGTGDCDFADDAVRNMIHLPIYPQMDESDIDKVAHAVMTVASELC